MGASTSGGAGTGGQLATGGAEASGGSSATTTTGGNASSVGGAGGGGSSHSGGAGGQTSAAGDGDAGVDHPSASDAGCASPLVYYIDHDLDGYGGDLSAVACEKPEDTAPSTSPDSGPWILQGGDCNDDDENVHPGASWGEGDMNCDGVLEPRPTYTSFVDVAHSCKSINSFQCNGVPTNYLAQGSPVVCGASTVECVVDNSQTGQCMTIPGPPVACR